MNCPRCDTPNAYVGFLTIECKNTKCPCWDEQTDRTFFLWWKWPERGINDWLLDPTITPKSKQEAINHINARAPEFSGLWKLTTSDKIPPQD